MTLMEVLHAIDGQRGDGTGTYIMRQGLYLSGVPYLWSLFGERAYIFPSKTYAEQLIHQYPEDLGGATVHQRFPEKETP